jgi:hypothetical protein
MIPHHLRRLALVTALAVACSTTFGQAQSLQLQNGSALAPGPIASVHDLTHCNCPRLPSIADDANPKPGDVPGDLSFDDLHAIFGTRDVRFGSWAAAVDDMENGADPDGSLGIRKDPEPPVVRDNPIDAGHFAQVLISGPAPRNMGNDFHSSMAYVEDAGAVELALAKTIARTEKYGEPAGGLRDAAFRLGHFLAVDLRPRVADRPDLGAHGLRDFNVSRSAMLGLISLIVVAGPGDRMAQARDRQLHTGEGLAVDAFDLAQAALEILTYADDRDPVDGSLFTDNGTSLSNEGNDIGVLGMVASAAADFGGPAPADSPQGIVACRAFATIVLYMDAPTVPGSHLRTAMVYLAQNTARDAGFAGTPATLALTPVYNAAIATEGPFDAAEAKIAVDSVSDDLMSSKNDAAAASMARTLGALLGSTNSGAYDVAAENAVQRQRYVARESSSDGDDQERRALAMWPGGETVTPSSGSPASTAPGGNVTKIPAVCLNGSCNAAIEAEDAQAPQDYASMVRLEFKSMLRPGEDTSTEMLARDEPFIITAAVPLDQNAGDFVEVTIAGSRGSTHWALHKANADGIYQYYTAQEAVTFESGGPGSYGFWRKWLLHFGFGDFNPFPSNDGETITASYGSASVPVEVYDNSWSERYARNTRSLDALWAYYDDLLQDPTIDRSLAAPNGPIHHRLMMIANYRQIVAYQSKPSDTFIFSVVSRAYAGDAYLHLMQESDAQLMSGSVDLRDARYMRYFANVTYTGPDEADEVGRGLRDAETEAKDAVWHDIMQLTIASYDAFLTGTCFVIKDASGGFAPCADEVWTLLTGTDAHGKDVTGGAYALTALGVAAPVMLHGAGSAVESYLEQRSAHKAATQAAQQLEAEAEAAAFGEARRSQALDAAAFTHIDEIEEVVDAENQLEKVRIDKQLTIPGAVQSTEGAQVQTVQNALVEHQSSPILNNPADRMTLQKYDDTCFLNAYERIRRKRGLPPRPEWQLIVNANQMERDLRTLAPDLTIYRAGSGTRLSGGAFLPISDGARTYTAADLRAKGRISGDSLTVKQMQSALAQDADVIAGIKVGSDSELAQASALRAQLPGVADPAARQALFQQINTLEGGHAVTVEKVFTDATGRTMVRYGDPWNGNYWDVDGCTFEKRLMKGYQLVMKWGKP